MLKRHSGFSVHGAVHHRVMQAIVHWLAIGAASLLLSGCGPLTDIVRDDTPVSRTGTQTAEQASERRDYLLAAHEYNQLAAATVRPQREDYQLRAVAALLAGGHIAQARQQLQHINTDGIAPVYALRRLLLQAHLAVADNNVDRALELLSGISITPDLPPDLRADIHRVRAEAFAISGNMLELARERVLLEPLLPTSQQANDNHRIIWDALTNLSPQALARLRTQPPPDILSGWMELAEMSSQYASQPQAYAQAVAQWRIHYPGHPAAQGFIEQLSALPEAISRYTHIALLLPLTGQFAKPATAVRDGFLAAYYAQPAETRPRLRIYVIDTNDPDSVSAHYQQAIADGAQFIVGPLRKSSVNLIASANELPVPTLALNYNELDTPGDANFFQFGLAPEDEARQVAEQAWLNGHSYAVAIVPQGDWGSRVLAAFQNRWEQLGGTLLEAQTYTADNRDFSTPVRQLLDINESRIRIRAIKALTGLGIKHEPRRRQDVDFIFMLGLPVQARQIRPQLKFHRASDLPVYTTSHAYAGKVDPRADRDMNGALFNDIPWLLNTRSRYQALRTQLLKQWPDTDEQSVRLYALGVDAYHLIPHLDRLQQYQSARYPGETGSLSMDEQRRIHRQLLWAQFIRGRPRLLEDQLAPPL